MFLRFICSMGGGHDPLMTGPFVSLGILEDQDCLEPHEAAWLVDIECWFNKHLPVPPFRARGFSERAVCWFVGGRNTALARMWDLVALYREKGFPMHVLRTQYPGEILYADAFQVVAQLPRRRAKRPLVARRRAL